MEREDRRNARFVDQVKSLQAALIEAAPILRPLADLDSLLREHQQPASNDLGSLRLSSSILRHCAELFSDSSVDDQWLDLARTMTNGVCSFCYEYLEDDDYEEACLVPDYEFDYENQLIILKHLRVRSACVVIATPVKCDFLVHCRQSSRMRPFIWGYWN